MSVRFSIAMNDRLFRVLGLLAVFSVFFSFTIRGFIDPGRSAWTQMDSHSDLRGPYFGAVDLTAGYDPYVPQEDSPSTRLLREYKLVRMKAGYSPPALMAYLPLIFLSFTQAKLLWLLMNFLLACLSVVLLSRLGGQMGAASLLITGYLVFNFHPIFRILEAGQNTLIVFVFLCLALIFLRQGRDFLAGILLAGSIFFKPFPAILFLGLALNRKGKALAGGAAAYAAGCLISSIFFGPGILFSFFREVAGRIGMDTWWANQSLLAFFLRVFSNNAEAVAWIHAPRLALALWGLCSAILLFLTGIVTLKKPAQSPVETVFNLSLWLVMGLIVSPRTIDNYCTWLLIPVTLLLWDFVKAGEWRSLALLAVSYMLLGIPGINWNKYLFTHHGPLLFFTSSQTWGMLLLFGLMIFRKKPGDYAV